MKTAKEWMNEICPPMTPNGQTLITPISWADIQQIQLEAVKWGAERAAEELETWPTARDKVRSFATNLTIDDLPK